jgi:hypothetical protein
MLAPQPAILSRGGGKKQAITYEILKTPHRVIDSLDPSRLPRLPG